MLDLGIEGYGLGCSLVYVALALAFRGTAKAKALIKY